MNCYQREAVMGGGDEVREPMGFHVLYRGSLAGCSAPLCMVSGRLHSFSGLQTTSSATSAATAKIRVFVLDVLNFVSFPGYAVSSWASRPLFVLLSLLGISYFLFVLVNLGQLSLGKVRGGRNCHIEHYYRSHMSLSCLHRTSGGARMVSFSLSMTGREWILGTQ